MPEFPTHFGQLSCLLQTEREPEWYGLFGVAGHERLDFQQPEHGVFREPLLPRRCQFSELFRAANPIPSVS